MSILDSSGLVESVVRYCCLCMVVFYNLVSFAMKENIEQRYAIKFCVKLNKYTTEMFASLNQAYGDATLSRNMVFKWHKALKVGRENVEETLVLEDQSPQQITNMWKWCEVCWRKTAD